MKVPWLPGTPLNNSAILVASSILQNGVIQRVPTSMQHERDFYFHYASFTKYVRVDLLPLQRASAMKSLGKLAN